MLNNNKQNFFHEQHFPPIIIGIIYSLGNFHTRHANDEKSARSRRRRVIQIFEHLGARALR